MSFWVCCSKDNPTKPELPELQLLTIICDPLAPKPDTTAQLTAQPVGHGARTTFKWQVSGGTLIEDDSMNVRWQVPHETGIYRVFLRATIGTAVDTMSRLVMVRHVVTKNTTVDYSFSPTITETDFFFIGSNVAPSAREFLGYHVYRLDPWSTSAEQITRNTSPTIDGGYSFTFFPDAVLASVVTGGYQGLRQQPMNVIVFPFTLSPKTYVSNNENAGTSSRRNQHVYPVASDDLSQFVWQYSKVGKSEDGSKDLVNILYRKSGDPRPTTLTIARDSSFQYGGWWFRYYKNIRPFFTQRADSILYFCDSTKTHKVSPGSPIPGFEPCIMPVDGTGPRTDLRREIGGPDSTGFGIFYEAHINISDKTVFQWNPAVPTQLGFIDAGGNFCLLDHVAAKAEVVGSVGKIKEFAWSDDGQAAVINKAGVVIVTPPGAPDTVFAKERPGDDIFGVNWSSGTTDQKLGFRIVRKGVLPLESFSAIVIYSVKDHQWYYASPRIEHGTEPTTVDYRWMRAVFYLEDLYMPVPVLKFDHTVTQVEIYHSYY